MTVSIGTLTRLQAACAAFALSIFSVHQTHASTAGSRSNLLWEKPLSPVTGAEDLYTSHRFLTTLSDGAFASATPDSAGTSADGKGECDGSPTECRKRSTDSRFQNTFEQGALRLTRFVLLDFPLDYMPMLIQHEAFGHGYRFLEAGYGDYSVGLALPPPYGGGHGFTEGFRPSRGTSLDENMTIAAGGLEANDVFAGTLREKWIDAGAMNFHEANLYLLNALNRPFYSARARYGFLNGGAGNDVNDYISLINLRYSGRVMGHRPLDAEDVQLRTLVEVLDPFTAYALWTSLGNYLVMGRPSYAFPMPALAGTRFLPLMRAGFTPFGLEYYLEAHFSRETRNMEVTYRQGDPGSEYFFGLGASSRNLWRHGAYVADLRVEYWRQPELLLGSVSLSEAQAASKALRGGGGLWLTLQNETNPGLVLETGFKTKGFVQGEPLDQRFILRAGISFFR